MASHPARPRLSLRPRQRGGDDRGRPRDRPPQRPPPATRGRVRMSAPGMDLVIRGGRIADGTGMPSYTADIGIRGGRIVKIGRVTEAAARVIDADGLAVTPG